MSKFNKAYMQKLILEFLKSEDSLRKHVIAKIMFEELDKLDEKKN